MCKVCVVFGVEWMEMDELELRKLEDDERFAQVVEEIEAEG
jgi:hypothetical protein